MERATVFGLVVLLAPVLLLTVLGSASLIDRPPSERATNLLVRLTMAAGLLAALGVLATMLAEGARHARVLGDAPGKFNATAARGAAFLAMTVKSAAARPASSFRQQLWRIIPCGTFPWIGHWVPRDSLSCRRHDYA